MRADGKFEVVVQRSLALVCFRALPPKGSTFTLEQINDLNQKLENLVNTRGIYIVHTALKGKYVLRFVPGSPWTEDSHIHAAWALIQTAADELLAAAAV